MINKFQAEAINLLQRRTDFSHANLVLCHIHLIKSLLTRGLAEVDLAFLLLGILNMLWIVVLLLLL